MPCLSVYLPASVPMLLLLLLLLLLLPPLPGSQDFFKRSGVAAMAVRELFEFVTDPVLADGQVDEYLDRVSAGGTAGAECVCDCIECMECGVE